MSLSKKKHKSIDKIKHVWYNGVGMGVKIKILTEVEQRQEFKRENL